MRLTSLRTAGLTLAVLLLCVAAAAPAKADSFTFTGTFTYDNDVRLFNFTVAAQSQVTLRTRSYAAGGFDGSVAKTASQINYASHARLKIF